MPFPNSPTNGQQATVNGITYTYSSTKTAWQRATNTTSDYTITGNITAGNTISAGYYWANGTALSQSIIYSGTSNIRVGTSGNITVAVANTSNVAVFSTTGITVPTLTVTTINASGTATITSSATTTAVVTNFSTANAQITGGTISGLTNLGATTAVATNFSTANAVITGGSLNSTTVGATTASTGRFTTVTATSGTAATSTGTGAVIVSGGLGVSGNVYASAVYVGSGSGNGLYWSANNAALSTGGGGATTAGVSPPASPTLGDRWYNTTSDVLYQYITDGTSNVWVDTTTPITSYEGIPDAIFNSITVTSANSTIGGYKIGYLNIPQISFSSNTTFNANDTGKHFYSTSASVLGLTIPLNSNIAFTVGTVITVVNQGSAVVKIIPTSGVSLYMGGNSTSTTRNLASYGVASVMKVATDTWFVNGAGVS